MIFPLLHQHSSQYSHTPPWLCELYSSQPLSFRRLFPESLKFARVIPIFKKGNPNDVSCYRPVSLLPIFSKILERVIHIQLVDYLVKHQLLDKEQHGFQSGRSTITAGIEFIQTIIDSVDKGEKVLGVFLDMTRAFDSVSHKKLLKALKKLGINGKELEWFESYLHNRQQFVEIEHSISGFSNKYNYIRKFNSRKQIIKHGVPQGSVLGPLLFLCYLRGLPGVVPVGSTICLFADDSNITISGDTKENVEISSFICLSIIKEFLDSKNLLLNSSKSNFISFCTKQTRNKISPQVAINKEIIKQVEVTKFLGLLIDENLSWDKHTDYVVGKMSTGLFALRQMANYCSLETLKTIYFSLVHSHLAYGISIYGATKKGNLDRILIQQKKSLRIMCKLKREDSVKHLFADLKILTVYGLYILETMTYVKQNFDPISSENNHIHNTRLNRQVETHNLDFFRKKTTFMGTKFLYKLPRHIILENNLHKFKSKAKEHLINLSLYSLDEYFLS